MSENDLQLPVIQTDLDEEEDSSCSPKIYVSNEEAAILLSMRTLREKSQELKAALDKADDSERASLADELEHARAEWKTLSARREKAYIRKMITLGHLPPGADLDQP